MSKNASITIRIDEATKKKLQKASDKSGRTLSDYTTKLLQDAMKKPKKL